MESLSVLKAALADRYSIEREIGAGGMATVYLARDLRHERPVALKLLNPELAAVLGVERFLAEIKVTANLQHPNLLPLFDSGEAQGLLYYVMPFVTGESLRIKLEREKQLPIEEAVRIAVAVANALDYAHGHAVIHRDLKPENILMQAGQPVVADFGIALAVSKAGGNRITQTGLSLGTPQYMSPEQATGERIIDRRSDIYSLGAVAYEMLTGEPPHSGTTAQAIMARVLQDQPRPIRSSRRAVPEHVEAAIEHALEKLPADRYTTAHEFAEALQGRGVLWHPSSKAGATAAAGGWRQRLRDPVVLGLGTLVLALLGLLAMLLQRPTADRPFAPVRFLYGGNDTAKMAELWPWPAAISPDGSALVYGVRQPGGAILYLKRSNELEAHPIPGTAGGYQPFFSPDGQWLAFEADAKEKKVRLDGSAPVTIAAGGWANGGDWTTADELVLGATDNRHGLSRVSVAGGEPAAFTHPDSAHGELQHLWPIALDDAKTIVFTIWKGTLASSELAITSLEDGKIVSLGMKGIRPLAVLDGALVYVQADGAVMAVPLDGQRKRVRGKPVPVHDPVTVRGFHNGNASIFVSRGGALVSAVQTRGSQLVWIGRDGVSRPIRPEVKDFVEPRLSPDGRRIAVIVGDGTKSDVWIHELATGTLSRLTTAETVNSAQWSKDGKRVIYSAVGKDARSAVWAQSVDGGSAPQQLVQLPAISAWIDISPDGRSLLAQSLGGSNWDVMRVALDSSAVIRPFSMSEGDDFAGRFSPNGRWAATATAETGRIEVYIRSFPDPTTKVQISAGGGTWPEWSADGKRLYYRAGESIVEVRLETDSSVRVISRDTVARNALSREEGRLGASGNFTVAPDGARFLSATTRVNRVQLVVVPNWLTEFRQRMASGN
jgi:eukaryotic-like serine/threonine-protein kinase